MSVYSRSQFDLDLSCSPIPLIYHLYTLSSGWETEYFLSSTNSEIDTAEAGIKFPN